MANVLSVAGSNSKYKIEGAIPAGFLGGLWHGMIAPITLIVSFFNQDARIYETNNNGRLYDLGFCIGAGIVIGDGAHQGIIRIG